MDPQTRQELIADVAAELVMEKSNRHNKIFKCTRGSGTYCEGDR